jgi:hypothetical protein
MQRVEKNAGHRARRTRRFRIQQYRYWRSLAVKKGKFSRVQPYFTWLLMAFLYRSGLVSSCRH